MTKKTTKKNNNQITTKELIVEILNYIIYIFGGLFLVIYLSIFTIETAQSLGNPIFGYQFYELGSGSMEPTLHIGEKILVQSTSNYEIGDIITFTEDGGRNFTTHRIIEIDGDRIITKGDANTGNDDPIRISNVMGKMIRKANLITFIFNIKYAVVAFFAIIMLITLFLKKE